MCWVKSCRKTLTFTKICQNEPEWGRIQLATLNQFRTYLAKYGMFIWIIYKMYHIYIYIYIYIYVYDYADSYFTHPWHISDKKFIHNSKWSNGCYATFHQNQCIRHGDTRDDYFQEISSRFDTLKLWQNGQYFAYRIFKCIPEKELFEFR